MGKIGYISVIYATITPACSYEEPVECPGEGRTIRAPDTVVFNRDDAGIDPSGYGGPRVALDLAEVERQLKGFTACGYFAARALPTLSRIEVRVPADIKLVGTAAEGVYACGALAWLSLSVPAIQVRTFSTRSKTLTLGATVDVGEYERSLAVGAPCATWAGPPCELGSGAGVSIDLRAGTWLLLTPGDNLDIAPERVELGPCPEEMP